MFRWNAVQQRLTLGHGFFRDCSQQRRASSSEAHTLEAAIVVQVIDAAGVSLRFKAIDDAGSATFRQAECLDEFVHGRHVPALDCLQRAKLAHCDVMTTDLILIVAHESSQ